MIDRFMDAVMEDDWGLIAFLVLWVMAGLALVGAMWLTILFPFVFLPIFGIPVAAVSAYSVYRLVMEMRR